LSDSPRYEALSYTWGDERAETLISIDDGLFLVRRNLDCALKQLRYDYEPRTLWIDAIRINQSDVDERGDQVSQMGSIYSKANDVVVWLGEATNDSNQGMDFLNEILMLGSHREPSEEGYSESDRKEGVERSVRDGRRCGERRGTRWEGIEERDWNRDNLQRPDTEGQATGTIATHAFEEGRTNMTTGKGTHNCHPSCFRVLCAVVSYSEVQGRDSQGGAPADPACRLKLLMFPPHQRINALQLRQGSHKFPHITPERLS